MWRGRAAKNRPVASIMEERVEKADGGWQKKRENGDSKKITGDTLANREPHPPKGGVSFQAECRSRKNPKKALNKPMNE